MNEKRIPLAEASPEQLRIFANQWLGMTLPPNAKETTLRSRVADAWSKDFILVLEQPDNTVQERVEAPPPEPSDSGNGNDEPKRRYVRLVINESDKAGGRDPVSVSVNGRAMLIERNVESEVPEEYYQVLKDAIEYRYDPNPDGNGLNPIPRKVHRYPFQVVRPATELSVSAAA